MKNLRVFIGDNEEGYITSASYILNSLGYTVAGTDRSGTSLLRKIRTSSPDIVIVDANLRGMSGLDISQIVESQGICPCILTFKGSPSEYAFKLENKLIDVYIQKPFVIGNVKSSVEQAYESFQNLISSHNKIKERKVIDKAKLLMMQKYNMPEQKVYEYMRKKSMNKGVPIYKVAGTIVEILDKRQ